VATGTLWSGEIRVGDTLHTASGKRPRVRGVQNHDRPAEVAYAGARTALDLVGVEASELEPGDVLLSSPLPPTAPSTPASGSSKAPRTRSRRDPAQALPRHAGDERPRALLDREGSRGGERAGPAVAARPARGVPGDRFVLRSSSPQVTVGGGVVLDASPCAPTRPDTPGSRPWRPATGAASCRSRGP
jgi:selenocysteine-specific elongation factor